MKLHYEQEGRGAPLVMLSGYGTDLSIWGLVRRRLSRHFQVILLDNRGSGRSPCPDSPYTVEDMAEDVRESLAELGLDKAYVLGHSMGGAIAQALAYKHPKVVDKLILANSLIQLRKIGVFSLHYFFKLRAHGLPFVTVFEGSLPWLFSEVFLEHEEQVEGLLQMVESYPYSQSLAGQKGQLEALTQFNSTSWFKGISVPTLVIEGKLDLICPFDSKRLAEGIAGSKRVVFTDQAHMPHIENPEGFCHAVSDFLNP